MSIRRQGTRKHPVLMALLMLIMRFCLAAHYANKDASTMLGPNGHRLKRFFEYTGLTPVLMQLICKEPSSVIGIGGQSIVIANGTTVEKYNYTLAGADSTVLATTKELFELDEAWLEKELGELVQLTMFEVKPLPLRWPFSTLTTLCATQQQLRSVTDIFDPAAKHLFEGPNAALKVEVTRLATTAKAWLDTDKWLDLIGPNNIVITTDFGAPTLRILDTGPYASEYITDLNPILGRTYKDVFMERLQLIQRYGRILILGVVLGVGTSLVHAHLQGASLVQSIYAFLDGIEDTLIG